MLSNDDFAQFAAWLQSANSKELVPTLQELMMDPSGDSRLLPYLESLLEDRTPAVISLPYRYGEICFLAARALAAERAKLGIQEPVILHNVILPLDDSELTALRSSAGIAKGSLRGALEVFRVLREKDYLPKADLEFIGDNIRIIGPVQEA